MENTYPLIFRYETWRGYGGIAFPIIIWVFLLLYTRFMGLSIWESFEDNPLVFLAGFGAPLLIVKVFWPHCIALVRYRPAAIVIDAQKIRLRDGTEIRHDDIKHIASYPPRWARPHGFEIRRMNNERIFVSTLLMSSFEEGKIHQAVVDSLLAAIRAYGYSNVEYDPDAWKAI
jgi:hypothetical protein